MYQTHQVKDAAIHSFIFTCEHGGNHIPVAYASLFRHEQTLLASHRGYDPGALLMAQELAAAFNGLLVTATMSRLLVDLNRSIGHPQLFSAATRCLPPATREEILAQYYRPYREQVERLVAQSISDGKRVIHISSHSFTPELDGKLRRADVGLLYHPSRPGEARLCAHWKAVLTGSAPALRVRRNYPYAGKGDGLTAYLRKGFSSGTYVGIELEINQSIALTGGARWTALRALLCDTLRTASAASVQ